MSRDYAAERAARFPVHPDGATCADCWHWKRCHFLLSLKGAETTCDWAPSRYRPHPGGDCDGIDDFAGDEIPFPSQFNDRNCDHGQAGAAGYAPSNVGSYVGLFGSDGYSGCDGWPRCARCGGDAVCIGAYEGAETAEYACDSCCGHGCEDGWCEPIEDAGDDDDPLELDGDGYGGGRC